MLTTGSLDEAVTQTLEITLTGTDIRSKTSTGVVERVDNAQGTSSGQTSRGHVGQEEFTELGGRVVTREKVLEGILEGKVEGLGREITDDVGEVSSPEGQESLLGLDSGEAVYDTSVTRDLSRTDARVGILSLDDKLDTLNGSGTSLGDGSRDTSKSEILQKVHKTLRHDASKLS